MLTSTASWQIVPYTGDSPYKKVRVRDHARVQAVLHHLQALECVALLGPPLSEKSYLLADVAQGLRESGIYRPLAVNLWRAQSSDESTFFTSISQLIGDELGDTPMTRPQVVPDARAFQNFLEACVDANGATGRHLALLIDHLQALPNDLVHSLLLALRATYMERNANAPYQFVAVVTGGMNLVGLSAGPTSPFNIAKSVVAGPLDDEQTLALATLTFQHLQCRASARSLERIVEWIGGDRYLVPRLCGWCAQAVHHHRRPSVTRAVVDRQVERMLLSGQSQAPIREAIRMIEEDPDTLLDVLHILDHGPLPRARSRQMITRTGTDRLQLSGAVILQDGQYQLKNRAFREALSRHFATERVGHVLRIAGRWQEAIEYLAPRLQDTTLARTSAPPASLVTQRATDVEHARPQLLEAIVQAIYATDSLEAAFEIMAQGLRQGFGLEAVDVYQADAARGQLVLVHAHEESSRPICIGLNDPAFMETQTFRYGNYALRGSTAQARLVAALVGQVRPLGVVTVERYVEDRDLHELPSDLPDLLRFLQHAANAVENVMVRAAYRKIGQAVLSTSTVELTLTQVLEAVSEAVGCDHAVLYLLDTGHGGLEAEAGTGLGWSTEWRTLSRLDAASRNPAMTCLRERRPLIVRGTDDRLNARIVDRYGLRDYALVFLPLEAGGLQLGTLELGYSGSPRVTLSAEYRRTLAAFADQVAIAVHNTQLLRRTDEALARRVDELEKLRSSSLAVSSTLDVDAVLTQIIRDVQSLFPGTEATIWEFQPETETFAVLQSSLSDAAYIAQQLSMESVSGQALLAQQPRAVTDLQSLPGMPIHDPAVRLGLHGMIAVPLISHQRVLGTINLYTYAAGDRPFEDQEEELLEAFAAQAAVAIDTARLHQQEIKRQRLEEELTVARRIQRSMLPNASPVVSGWQFDAVYQAARIVGGDFYDFYELPGKPSRLGMTIADVADKGVPAALFMALSRTIIRSTALSGRGPASALLRANQLILNDSEADLFLSAVYAVLELDTGRMIYANGGHNRPLWYHGATGEISELGGRGIVLGVFEQIELEERRIDVAPGDVLVFYTDGVTEAISGEGEEFGRERLEAVLARCGHGSAGEILQAILDALVVFTAGSEPHDDVTCVVVRRE